MQFGDVRSLMHLPMPGWGLTHGCNFVGAAAICNLVSGISVSLFKPAQTKKHDSQGRWVDLGAGDLFKALLVSFYPWQNGESQRQKEEKSHILYKFVRNPFAHSLGVHGKAGYLIRVNKSVWREPEKARTGLTHQELDDLERSPVLPSPWPPALQGGGQQWDFCVESLYWGVFHLLWNLAKDAKQMQQAEMRFVSGNLIWSK